MANSLGQDIPAGTVVVLSDDFPGTEEDRRFVCEAGFGLHHRTRGSAVFGYLVRKGPERKDRIDGYDLLKIAKDQTVPEVKPEPLPTRTYTINEDGTLGARIE